MKETNAYIIFNLVSPVEQDTCKYWCDENVNMSIIIVIGFVTIILILYCCRYR